VGEDIKCRQASMGVHGDEVAYSMNFEVLVNLSVFLDRAGNFISSSGVAPKLSPKTEESMVEEPESLPAGETASDEPQVVVKAPAEKDASSPEGSYEEVLKAFAPIESKSDQGTF
jgi:hypothetical protein